MDACRVAVIGAGPAGLATAAVLSGQGVEARVFDRAATPGASWRQHYDRLHLHTVRWLSGLPGLPLPRSLGRWVAARDYADYLEHYAVHHRLTLSLGTPVLRVARAEVGWQIETASGPWRATQVVVATGLNRSPRLPDWSGRDVYAGNLLHTSRYRSAAPFVGQRVLVVGCGNSGAEIACDLVEGGATRVMLSVRTGPNMLPRAILGLPTQLVGVLCARLPTAPMDAVADATGRLTLGDLSSFGLPRPPQGVFSRIRHQGLAPVLDVGLARHLKAGHIELVPAVRSLEREGARLIDGRRCAADAIVVATGFVPDLRDLLGGIVHIEEASLPGMDRNGEIVTAGGLYLCGYQASAGGMLREIGQQARRIGGAITRAGAQPFARAREERFMAP